MTTTTEMMMDEVKKLTFEQTGAHLKKVRAEREKVKKDRTKTLGALAATEQRLLLHLGRLATNAPPAEEGLLPTGGGEG